jgi:uncharacterized protein
LRNTSHLSPPDSGIPRRNFRIGVIADTHGLLRPEAQAFLRGADHIVHAGDIGNALILEDLRAIAELSAVRGNNDVGTWAAGLPQRLAICIGALPVYLLHDRAELRECPPPDGTRVVIAGHSHQPLLERLDGRLFINPGSAGRRRFKLPIAIGEIRIEAKDRDERLIEARVIDLASQAVLAQERVREVGHTLIDSANLLI